MPIAVEIAEPVRATSAVVFASPHSGRVYPQAFLAAVAVDPLVLRSSEDAYVDLLLAQAPDHGAPLITSQVPRAYVDFNRAADELDPALVNGAKRAGLNPRIASGLGVLARVVANGRAIYSGKIEMPEAKARISRYWHPYHAALSATLERQHRRFGQVLLCDVHSMPHEALSGHVSRGASRPDIVIGDRWGAACGPEIAAQVEAVFRAAGLTVARNAPFAGAYITQRYGQPAQGMHVIQIEIDRALYLDEARVEPSAQFPEFQRLMGGIVAQIARIDVGGVPLEVAAQ
ncbi:N-formylglutamate amidohydrolase [Pararhodobacter sp.]|uniref:N-formylglutamate amidohydrolase n=1 Tax=Pararhodobacter sp. TaxID=2127056 RepID=UPI002AFFD14D|nr:N-formylglutamate amidohydrolase [Pararhodobacter sp.]